MTIKYRRKNKLNKRNGIKKTIKKNGGGLFDWWNRRKALQTRQKDLEKEIKSETVKNLHDDVFSVEEIDTSKSPEPYTIVPLNKKEKLFTKYDQKDICNEVKTNIKNNIKKDSEYYEEYNKLKNELNKYIYGQHNPYFQSFESLKSYLDNMPEKIWINENRLRKQDIPEWEKRREEYITNLNLEKEKLIVLTQQLNQMESRDAATHAVDNLEQEQNMQLFNELLDEETLNNTIKNNKNKIEADILQTEDEIRIYNSLIFKGDEDIQKKKKNIEDLYSEQDSLKKEYNERLDNILKCQKDIELVSLKIRCIPRTQRNWRHWFTGGKKTKKQRLHKKIKKNK